MQMSPDEPWASTRCSGQTSSAWRQRVTGDKPVGPRRNRPVKQELHLFRTTSWTWVFGLPSGCGRTTRSNHLLPFRNLFGMLTWSHHRTPSKSWAEKKYATPPWYSRTCPGLSDAANLEGAEEIESTRLDKSSESSRTVGLRNLKRDTWMVNIMWMLMATLRLHTKQFQTVLLDSITPQRVMSSLPKKKEKIRNNMKKPVQRQNKNSLHPDPLIVFFPKKAETPHRGDLHPSIPGGSGSRRCSAETMDTTCLGPKASGPGR